MTDITELIRDDHDTMRAGFAAIEAAASNTERASLWGDLADLLELHAAAEEAVFYPHVLKQAGDGAEETEDAIGDHNDIRDAVAAAQEETVGSPAWWQAVRAAQQANDEHLDEEESGPLPDFTAHSSTGFRDQLGTQFTRFKTDHPHGQGADESDKDPDAYIAANT